MDTVCQGEGEDAGGTRRGLRGLNRLGVSGAHGQSMSMAHSMAHSLAQTDPLLSMAYGDRANAKTKQVVLASKEDWLFNPNASV